MSVTLGEFVQVMTGGKVVTDDLWVDCRIHINQAVTRLQAVVAALAKVDLTDSAVDAAILAAEDGLRLGLAETKQAEQFKLLQPIQKAAEAAAAREEKRLKATLALKKQHTIVAQNVLKSIDQNLAELDKLDDAAVAQKLTLKLNDLKTQYTTAASVDTADDLETKIEQLMTIRSTAAEVGGAAVTKLTDLGSNLIHCRSMLSDIADDTLRQSVSDALDTLQQTIANAALGKNTKGAAVGVQVEHTKITLTAMDLLRGVEGIMNSVRTALRDPASQEREMMELEGPKPFVEGLEQLNQTVIAFGASQKPLSSVEALSIHRYMGNDYSDMNSFNLGTLKVDPTKPADLKKKARLERLYELCEEALSKLPPYPKTAWPTYRAERAWSQDMIDGRYGKANTFVTGVFWSTGAGSEVDLSKSTPKFSHIIFGLSGKDVAHFAALPGEGAARAGSQKRPGMGRGEVLFSAKTKFSVKDRTDPGPGEMKPGQTLAYAPGPEYQATHDQNRPERTSMSDAGPPIAEPDEEAQRDKFARYMHLRPEVAENRRPCPRSIGHRSIPTPRAIGHSAACSASPSATPSAPQSSSSPADRSPPSPTCKAVDRSTSSPANGPTTPPWRCAWRSPCWSTARWTNTTS